MPARPKPGVGQGRRSSINVGGILGAMGGAPGGGAPDATSGANVPQPQVSAEDSEYGVGSASGGASPTVTLPASNATYTGAVPKPSWLQMQNPAVANAYSQSIYNTLPTLAAAAQRQAVEGQQVIQQQNNQQLLGVASKYGIQGEDLPKFMADITPVIHSASLANAQAGANQSTAQANATDTSLNPNYQASVNAGVNASAGMPSADFYAKTRTELQPGSRAYGFTEPNITPVVGSGSSGVQTSNTKRSGFGKDANGMPVQTSTDTTGNTFGGGSTPSSNAPQNLQDLFKQYQDSQSNNNTTSTSDTNQQQDYGDGISQTNAIAPATPVPSATPIGALPKPQYGNPLSNNSPSDVIMSILKMLGTGAAQGATTRQAGY